MSNRWITFDDRGVTVQVGLRIYWADRKNVYNKKRINFKWESCPILWQLSLWAELLRQGTKDGNFW